MYREFRFWGQSTPDAIAVLGQNGHLSYAQALQRVDAAADRLHAAGVRPGARVGIPYSNPLRITLLQFALDKLGACSCIGCDEEPWLDLVIDEAPGQHARSFVLALQESAETTARSVSAGRLEPYDWQPRDSSRIKRSSGSTGKRKRIHRSYESTRVGLDINRGLMPLGPGITCAATVGWAGPGITLRTNALTTGSTLALLSAEDERTYEQLRRFGVRVLAASPSKVESFLRFADAPLPDLMLYLFGGRASPALVERTTARLTANLVMTYGSTETSTCAAFFLKGRKSPGHTVAFPCGPTRVEVVGPEGLPCPPGTTGRVRISALSTADGYVDAKGRVTPFNPADPAWFFPGDLGETDDAGAIHVMGRDDDVLNFGGTKVVAAIVEDAIERSGLTLEHAALNLTQGDRGTEPMVAAVLKPGVKAPQLQAALRSAFPFIRAPVTLVVMSQLPRLPTTKVDLSALRELTRARIAERKRMPT